MTRNSKETEQDTSNGRPSNLPVYLCSPTPELRGWKLLKCKLDWFREDLPTWVSAPFPNKQFVKAGPEIRLQEALTMTFIAQNTSIPVPRVLDFFSYRGSVYLVQERIRGPVLEDVWHRLSPREKDSCMMQIKDYLGQLRALKPPHLESERVEAVDGSGLVDSRLGLPGVPVWGPFDNHAQFHRFLIHDTARRLPERFPEAQEPLAKVAGRKYKSVFCHGDFGPHNMMWKDGKVIVIDWEMSGWFPEYWEYVRAHAARGRFTDWWNLFEEVVTPYNDELEVQIGIESNLSG